MSKKKPTRLEAGAKSPLSIRAVYVRKCSLALDDNFDPLVPGQQLNAKFTCRQDGHTICEIQASEAATEVSKSVAFHNQFDFVFFHGASQTESPPTIPEAQQVAATISACICVDYVMTGEQPNSDELATHANTSMIHAWPYWREYCHSTMLRMQLPVVLAPLLVIGQPTAELPPPPESP